VVLLRLVQLGIAGAVGRRRGRAGLPGRAWQHRVLGALRCMLPHQLHATHLTLPINQGQARAHPNKA
jgi:hypothetical protein